MDVLLLCTWVALPLAWVVSAVSMRRRACASGGGGSFAYSCLGVWVRVEGSDDDDEDDDESTKSITR